MIERKPLTAFLVLAFLISWSLFLVPLVFKGADTQTHQMITTVAFALAMWGPGIAAIVVTLASGGKFSDLGLKRLGPKRFYLWAWLLFPVLAFVTGAVTVLLGFGSFDPDMTLIRKTLAALPEASPLSPAIIVALQIGAALTVAPLFNTLF
ncbi:MAG: hypothetical protein L3J16_01415 [Anaerolineales bacterium]|nr:hypothetical protein [Anaerolineales bacterium]